MRQAGLFGLSDHLKRLSAHGDPLEELGRIVDFESFRPTRRAALSYADRSKAAGLRMIRWQCSRCWSCGAEQRQRRANGVSDPRPAELAFASSGYRPVGALPSVRLGRADADANTIRLFREKLAAAGALDTLFEVVPLVWTVWRLG